MHGVQADADDWDSRPWTETVLYSFCSLSNCADGYNPAFRLLIDHHGTLYGTTPYGGAYRGGTVFKLTPPTGNSRLGRWTETVLYSFCAQSNCTDGVDPQGDLIMDQHGALFGATEYGPISSNLGGTVFKLTPPARSGGLWTETILYTFCSLPNCVDGAQPRAGLLMDQRGTLYGTTQAGDTQRPQGGTVFKLTPPSVKGDPCGRNRALQILLDKCVPRWCRSTGKPHHGRTGRTFWYDGHWRCKEPGHGVQADTAVRDRRSVDRDSALQLLLDDKLHRRGRSRVWLNHGQTRRAFWHNQLWWVFERGRHDVQADATDHGSRPVDRDCALPILLAVELRRWFSA